MDGAPARGRDGADAASLDGTRGNGSREAGASCGDDDLALLLKYTHVVGGD
jgi:hypothetical protein